MKDASLAGPDKPPEIRAGSACVDLIADPASWINRRVETIELLAQEETRRRVSIDFTLAPGQIAELTVPDGVVIPLSLLTKAPRRNFDLRDETGRAIPVLGKGENAALAHIAALRAAIDALGDHANDGSLRALAADLRQIVFMDPEPAFDVLASFAANAADGQEPIASVWADPVSRQMLSDLWQHYVLFAVLPPGGPTRRILKYSYGEDFDLGTDRLPLRERLSPAELGRRFSRPDRARFLIECPGAWRAASFHVEIATPEELRFDRAVLFDFTANDEVSSTDEDVDRASLYASRPLAPGADVAAYVEITPERSGRAFQAAATSLIVGTLLWLGVISDLDAENPGPAVSILLAGAAVFSGVSAGRGEHKLVRLLFSGTRKGLGVVTVAALAGSASLALEYPTQRPVCVWWGAATVCTLAALRLIWAAIRAPA